MSGSNRPRFVWKAAALLHADVVKTPPDVQFREVLGPSELSDELRDERQQVFVFHGHGAERLVVLYQPKHAVLLLYEEDGRRHRRLGRVDAA